MPKTARSPEEVEAVRRKILEEALSLITKHGYDGFTMRKLGKRMGVTAKTIYNYFRNKDEIYLHLLMMGFELLYDDLIKSCESKSEPLEKLEAVTRAFFNFGLKKANYYDIMLTWYVPKYNNFIGTELEPLAYNELQTALKTSDLITQIFEDLIDKYGHMENGKARLLFLQWLTGIHGIIALYNNTILSYVHETPDEILNTLVKQHLMSFDPR
jgi:AcrR family transcriptional regulator